MCLENTHKKRMPWVRRLNGLAGPGWELGLIQAEGSQYLSWVLHVHTLKIAEGGCSQHQGKAVAERGFRQVLGAGCRHLSAFLYQAPSM